MAQTRNNTTNNKNIQVKKRILLEKLRIASKENHFSRANLWIKETNNTEASLQNISFTLAVFLFTFSSPIFIQTKILGDTEKTLLIIAWLLLLLSLTAGIVNVTTSIKYFAKSAERENKAEKLWSRSFMTEDEYNETVKETARLFYSFSPHSNLIPLILQVTFLIMAFILILLTAIFVLLRI